jgi:hypothetical protein
MRSIYPHTQGFPAPSLRQAKASLLGQFQRDGFYLCDGSDKPLGGLTPAQKVRVLRSRVHEKFLRALKKARVRQSLA